MWVMGRQPSMFQPRTSKYANTVTENCLIPKNLPLSNTWTTVFKFFEIIYLITNFFYRDLLQLKSMNV